ncbi:MAG: rRNA (cytidine-2'-O-)-methyltransferase, partial [Clostridia bacterium]|nr:rRNA (cytidine-2'-O-)-methyltransferase [Clostridia bacterium]
ENGLEYTVIPGETAFVCGLVMSGLLDYRFSFVGFLPEKKSERKKLLQKYKNADCPLVFYCAPHDVEDTVKSLCSAFGNRKAVAVREITKAFESRYEFNLESGYDGETRGEFVLIVEGATEVVDENAQMPVNERIDQLMSGGMSKKDAIKTVAKERNLPKNEIYQYTVDKN